MEYDYVVLAKRILKRKLYHIRKERELTDDEFYDLVIESNMEAYSRNWYLGKITSTFHEETDYVNKH